VANDRREVNLAVPVPKPHRSPKAPEETPWNWNGPRRTKELLEHGGWEAMARAHAWYEKGPGEGSLPRKKSAYKLPNHQVIDGKPRVAFAGVESAMNVLASTRFGGEVEVRLPADEVRAVYEHLAEHYRRFGRRPPRILRGWGPRKGGAQNGHAVEAEVAGDEPAAA
jgi:hypothetical protein